MSVLIKGMEMPQNCGECKFFAWKRGVGNHCAIDDSITFHPTLDGLDVRYEKNGNCPLVKIVHCKDCVYMEHGVKDSNEVWCCWHDSRMMENDFCSRGKDREA